MQVALGPTKAGGDGEEDGGVTKEGPNKYIVDQAVLDRFSKNGTASQVRVIPHKDEGGQIDGYRLSAFVETPSFQAWCQKRRHHPQCQRHAPQQHVKCNGRLQLSWLFRFTLKYRRRQSRTSITKFANVHSDTIRNHNQCALV